MAAEKRIAVLMACYNRADTTLECLKRLFEQTLPEGYSFDVWLVDDASPDGTGEKVKTAYPQVNVIRGSGNLFWCKGMRLAWENAVTSYEYDAYLWLNDDVMLYDGALNGILADAMKCPGMLVAGALEDLDEGIVSYGAMGKATPSVLVPNGSPQLADGALNGNLLFVPCSVSDKIGMIDNAYSHGCGDTDYGRMARSAGVDVYVSSEVLGSCRVNHGKLNKTKEMPLRERFALLFSPLGFPLRDTWHYRRKFDGTFRAVISCAHVAFMVLSGRR